jgi:restriction system protein
MSQLRFTTFMGPLIEALKELGGSGTPSEVREKIAAGMYLSDDILDEQLETGSSRFENQVHWARFYLVKAGYLESSQRGVWSLTEKGLKSIITEDNACKIARSVKSEARRVEQVTVSGNSVNGPVDEDEQQAPPESGSGPTGGVKNEILELMREMPPDAFERLCQRFLRESGFQQVEVTGRSGDGGIDGRGLLQVNPLMSIHVLFQCKRYKGSVGSEALGNFRGAMTGRTDKGIFITTGMFTSEAKREALREGAPPIELVDADKLVTMFEKLEMGLKPKTIYEIDKDFWDEFV